MTPEDEVKIRELLDLVEKQQSNNVWLALGLLCIPFTIIFIYQEIDFRFQLIEKHLGLPTPAERKENK